MDGWWFCVGALTVGACCGALAAPAAGQVGLVDDPRATSVALAGPDVLVARTGRDESVAVDAVRRGGGARRVLSVASPGRASKVDLRLAASPQRLALLMEIEHGDRASEWRLYSGPPAGPASLALRVRWTSRRTWIPIGLDVDGAHVLLLEFRIAGYRTRARVLPPGGAPTIVPWPGSVAGPAAIAGDRIAFVGSDRSERGAPVDRVFVADWRTGAVATTLYVGDPDDVRGEDVDLAADGSTVVADAGRLVTRAPGGMQRSIPHAGMLSAPRFAGAAGIAALRHGLLDTERPLIVDPAGGAARPLGDRSTALTSFVADASGAAWLANGCVRYAPLDGSPLAASDPCPAAEVYLDEGDQVLRGRSLRILVTCVAASDSCRGTALLGGRGRFGRGRFDVPEGERRRVVVRLTRRGMRHVARRLGKSEDPLLDGVPLSLGARVRDGRVPDGRCCKIALVVRRVSR